VLAARPLTLLIAPGFAETPQVLEHTVLLVRICFPYILFISGVALCMGILNARDHFLAPALAPCVLNLVLISAALLAVWLGWPVPLVLAWAVLVAGLGQWLLQQPFLRRQGFRWRGKASLRHPGVLRIGRLMGPTILGAAVYQLNIVLGTVLASFLALGSISFLYYADRLVQFPLGVFGVAVSQAALPSFSQLAADGEQTALIHTLNRTLGLLFFISLPATAGLIALAHPMVATLFGRGAFDAQAVQATAGALIGYSTGLPAFCCVRSLVSAYYSLEDTKTPVRIATLCLVLNGVLGVVLMQYLAHVGLALAVAAASWANVLLLLRGLRGHFGGRWLQVPGVARMAVLSVAVGIGAWATASWGGWSLAGIPVWALGYLGAAHLLRLPETGVFMAGMATLQRRFGRR
ncbi:MAG: murein biosynthesis integral membrane protein MurJ, partial [Thermodesulfobacteriota bacterium]